MVSVGTHSAGTEAGQTTRPNVPSAESAPFRRSAVARRTRSLVPPVLALGVVCGLWQLIVSLAHVPLYLVPPFSTVVAAMWSQAGTLLPNAWATTEEVLVGFGASIVIGIPLAVAIVSSKPLENAIYPLLVSSQVIPKVALAPLFVVWFGLGILPKVVLVFLISFFPVVIDTAVGLRSIETEKLYLARSMGASWIQTLMRFRLPHALPNIFGGIRLAATFSVIGAVVGEFVGASKGLGYIVESADAAMNTVTLFAGIAYLTIIGMLMFFAVGVAEHFMLPWHVSHRDNPSATR